MADRSRSPTRSASPARPTTRWAARATGSPSATQAQLTLDPDDQIWKGTFDLPAGDYAFKVAINRAWTENYGAGAVLDGANIPFTHPGGPVTFYYDHGTHWVTNDVLSEIITAPGSAQSELGLPRRLVARLHAAVAAGPRRRRHVDVVDDARSRPGRTRSR